MKRTIVIKTEDEQIEIPVKATIKAMQIYRAEFGSDLSRDLTAVYDTLNPDPFSDAMKRAKIVPGQLTAEELQQQLLANLDYSAIHMDEQIPDEETQMKMLQIVWAMAKAADDKLEPFEAWTDKLDIQPIRSLTETVQKIWREANSTTIEIKN